MTDEKRPGNNTLHRDTLAVHAAVARSQYGENAEALYLTSGYVQPDAETAARRFAGEEDGYTYSRLGNPTVTSMELRLAALEGTEAAIATASGMSAVISGEPSTVRSWTRAVTVPVAKRTSLWTESSSPVSPSTKETQ